MKGSWRTTLAGVVSILGALGAAGNLILNQDFAAASWTTIFLGLTTGAGLINSRDNKVTSEQAGIKPTAP
jgi:hypothetical protein